MNFKIPKNDAKYHWTNHVIRKMGFYGLSPDRVRRVISNPKRVEDGVAENTVAVMQPGTNTKKPTEVWVMYQQKSQNEKIKMQNFRKKIVISAWRYPGISPIGKAIPIPADILEELKNEGVIS
ncbi:MAG: hypothetical protein Q8R55_02910 [Candidatus Taylorbacteria bacterium]|nr:hypothetical protein [Candidatus Taylorbacteria bacterium]